MQTITIDQLFSQEDIDMVEVSENDILVQQMYIEDGMEKLNGLAFIMGNFNAIYKYERRFKEIARNIIDRLNCLQDANYNLEILSRLAQMAKTLGISIK